MASRPVKDVVWAQPQNVVFNRLNGRRSRDGLVDVFLVERLRADLRDRIGALLYTQAALCVNAQTEEESRDAQT